jgi:uncharacterized delta-60 repeat protein
MKTTLRKLPAAWPLVVSLLLLPAFTRAETPVQSWVQHYNGPGSGDSQARAVAVDSSNNVIVAGYSTGSGSGQDYTTIKYSGEGVPLWTNRYNAPGNGLDIAYAVAVDGGNNVTVAGYSTGSGSGQDYTTIKYSSAGVPLWTNRYNGPANSDDLAYAVAVDGSNDVIVTGRSYGNQVSTDYVTIKYSGAGVPLWTNRYNGPGNANDGAAAIAVDGSNDVIVTGLSDTGAHNVDYATVKYSSAGVPLWTNRYNGPGNYNDYATALVVDRSGNVVVTGSAYAGSGSFDFATIKYSSDGVPLWTNRYNGPANDYDYARAVAVDSNNDVIVAGYSYGSGTSRDYATIKYSSDGVLLWANRYNGPANDSDEARALAVDGGNNVIVTGSSTNSGTRYDYTTIKYSSDGVPLWTNCYSGPGNGDDQAVAAAVDHSGNVIVTGYSTNSGSSYDFATIKYICVPEPVLTGLQLTNGTFQMRVDGVLQPGVLVIEGGTSLSAWAPIFTNTTPTNVVFYTDPDAGSFSTRFYRAFQSP